MPIRTPLIFEYKRIFTEYIGNLIFSLSLITFFLGNIVPGRMRNALVEATKKVGNPYQVFTGLRLGFIPSFHETN